MITFFGNDLTIIVILFVIISSRHLTVQCGIFNKQNPATIQHDLYRFIEATRAKPREQSPSNLQQEFHRFIRKTGGSSELQSSYSTLASQPQSSFVQLNKPQGEFNEEGRIKKRNKRSFYMEQVNFKPAEPSYVARNVDQHRFNPFESSDFGRLERAPKYRQPQSSPRPRGLTKSDYRHEDEFPRLTGRFEIIYKSQRQSPISLKPQDILNPFLNQPIDPHRNAKFQSFDNRFITHNEPHTKLHNSDTLPVIKTSNKPSSSDVQNPHQFFTSNSRPKKKKGHKNSHFTIKRPQTDQSLSFSLPSNRPVDFFSILNKPVTSFPNVPDTNDDKTENSPNRPLKTKGHKNSHFKPNRPQLDQSLDFFRPNNRPDDFFSILNKPVTSAVQAPETYVDETEKRPNRKFTKPSDSSGSGCTTASGLRRPGETWYSDGCRRNKCIAFRNLMFIETDQCDTEIYNAHYKCIIEVDIKAKFPHCCPRYRCNPDNLGNLVDRAFV